ncbi:MAG: response regulator [Candidatus Omnitrophota bacterium]
MAHKKILIVDNDSSVCDSMATLLRLEGYSVDETTDSAEAEMLIKKERYDVCLFDYKMDGLKGTDLLKLTKNENPRCLVFIISGMVDIDKSSTKLADGIINKPFHIEALLQRIAATA